MNGAMRDCSPFGSLSCVELTLSTGQKARAFFKPPEDPRQMLRPPYGINLFERSFVLDSEDDEDRFSILARAVGQPKISVDLYEGESNPPELHAFVHVNGERIMACVLGSREVVCDMVDYGPVVESFDFQAVDDYEPGTLFSALHDWIQRVWPDTTLPDVEIDFSTLVGMNDQSG